MNPSISTEPNDLSKCLTAWVNAIQRAQIVQLERTQKWFDDEGLIQVKRMTEHDLEKEVDVPESEHAYEDMLDVIKLPLAIPEEKISQAPQFLFVRSDDYDLFRCTRLLYFENCVVMGNPGISKSWFQWKFILFCYRQDLYHSLWPLTRTQHDEPRLKKPKLEASLSSAGDEMKMTTSERDTLMFPQTIVRTLAGEESYLFPICDAPEVGYRRHKPSDLKHFTDKTMTILWEPNEELTPVYYYAIKARVLATVSPNEDRIHQFRKSAELFFMPCPSELQLRLMGQVYRSAGVNNIPSDTEIHERVRDFGPFIRLCLLGSKKVLSAFKVTRNQNLKVLCQSGSNIIEALQSSLDVLEPSSSNGWTHRVARYVVNRDQAMLIDVYGTCCYRMSCEYVLAEISKIIATLGIEQVIAHLVKINEGDCRSDECIPKLLERVFGFHALHGIHWKCRRLHFDGRGSSSSNVDDWQSFDLKLDHTVQQIVGSKDMVNKALYYPSDASFPLVDMYYKDDAGSLVGIQATMASSHPKPVSTYESFYEKIGTTPEATPLCLYFLILPRQVNAYNSHRYADSKFWKQVRLGVPKKWKENIQFFVLLPPSTFQASFERG